jgi:hypothetical protein
MASNSGQVNLFHSAVQVAFSNWTGFQVGNPTFNIHFSLLNQILILI